MTALQREFSKCHEILPPLLKSIEAAITSLLLDIWSPEIYDPEVVLYEENELYFATVVDNNKKEIILPATDEGSMNDLAAIEALRSRLESGLIALQEQRS
jgi:hypothetical protein